MRTYKGYEIVSTDSGWGARPLTRPELTIGMEGTLGGRGYGYSSLREIKDRITEIEREESETVIVSSNISPSGCDVRWRDGETVLRGGFRLTRNGSLSRVVTVYGPTESQHFFTRIPRAAREEARRLLSVTRGRLSE